jgi:DNA polymerase-4
MCILGGFSRSQSVISITIRTFARMKVIHVDMDQFFAAVEQRENPELRGKPIAVGHDAERGVVSTASYEARRFGVHSAQSIQVAKRLCPQLIIVEPHFQKYKEVSA